MKHADEVLEDEQLVATVYEALARRSPKSRTRGRRGTPAEVVMRLLLLKHIRNWSYEVLEREVRANLVYRDFTRVGAAKAPDAKTMGRWGLALGPEGVEKIHGRVVEIAQGKQVVKGRKMRLDTTVVETNIHYPTDSNLLGDGVRVLIRAMKRIGEIAGLACGVALRIVLGDRESHSDQEIDRQRQQLGRVVSTRASLLQWPAERRPRDVQCRAGLMHVKAAVADSKVAFLTSANLTEAALERNMELGVLFRGGSLPAAIGRLIDALVESGELQVL